jgi:hypothetical protein
MVAWVMLYALVVNVFRGIRLVVWAIRRRSLKSAWQQERVDEWQRRERRIANRQALWGSRRPDDGLLDPGALDRNR